ncbi:MAG TPA: MFS transporter [Gaiellaceae bacterium]|nr:MFS transporter [Gaiellaceae bacterium]
MIPLSRTLGQVRAVVGNRNIRHLELAYASATTSEWAFTVALAVFAYQRGGARDVGILGLVRMAPAALATPFTAAFADRYERERALVAVSLLSAVALAASAALFYGGRSEAGIFAFAAAHAVVSTLCRPTVSALLPSLATSPEQLVAANAVSLALEGLGTLVGPLVAGLLVATANVGVVFVFGAVSYVASALALAAIHVEGRLRFAHQRADRKLAAGFRLLAHEPQPRLIVGLFVAQTLVRGSLNVLVVVIAFRLLHAGGGWVGFLSGAVGAGTLLGGFTSVAFTGRRLALPFGFGLVLWGVPIALIAAGSSKFLALLLLVVLGIGNAIEDVTGETLLQRLVSDEVLGRVFGVMFGLATAGFGVGAIVAPALIAGLGNRGALVATGLFLPALVLVSLPALRRIDASAGAPTRELQVLDQVPMFAPLPLVAKEQLARSLVATTFAAGEPIIEESQIGDRFYILVRGRVTVTHGGQEIGELDRGDFFGEIALLRDIPRTSTVTARDDVETYVLDRRHFLEAAIGHAAGREAGEAVVAERLAALTPE